MTGLLIGCMEILFLKLAATIFGLDYLIALPHVHKEDSELVFTFLCDL
jgi:hypothetical protein